MSAMNAAWAIKGTNRLDWTDSYWGVAFLLILYYPIVLPYVVGWRCQGSRGLLCSQFVIVRNGSLLMRAFHWQNPYSHICAPGQKSVFSSSPLPLMSFILTASLIPNVSFRDTPWWYIKSRQEWKYQAKLFSLFIFSLRKLGLSSPA